MGYRVIYVEKSEHLKLYLDNLKVENNEMQLIIPISDIQILIIDNYSSTLTIPLINKLTEKNVCTIICGVDHLPKSCILPTNGNFETSGNITKQIQWKKENKGIVHKEIARNKILNQREILIRHNKSTETIDKLKEFANDVQFDDVTNREGLAAKMYFRSLFGENFIRFENDVINAGLNYGYSIFRSLITSTIVAKGYLPNIGIFHKGKQNMFNLSDDIIEVFRPIVDEYVHLNMMEDILFKQSHKDELVQLTNNKIIIADQKQTIANAISIYLDTIFKKIEGSGEEKILFPGIELFPYDI